MSASPIAAGPVSALSRRTAGWTCVLALVPFAAAGQGRHDVHLSEDLAERLRTGDTTETSVIITGTQATINALAARHGLRVAKRLQTGAVVEVPAGRLQDVVEDGDLDQLSGTVQRHIYPVTRTFAVSWTATDILIWDNGLQPSDTLIGPTRRPAAIRSFGGTSSLETISPWMLVDLG